MERMRKPAPRQKGPEIKAGVVHGVPKDIGVVLQANPTLRDLWNGLTEIQRNEWICWVTIVKKPETRKEHIERLVEDVLGGKRKPCCWPGCPHRNPNAAKFFR